MLNLDDTMHLHVGYYGVTLKKYDHLELLVGKYIIEDDQIEEEGNKLFECFLKENDIVK